MTARTELAAEDSVDAITDALLTASRLLVAISARSIASVDETITIPQFRVLVILSARGSMNVRTLAGLLRVQRSTTGRMVGGWSPRVWSTGGRTRPCVANGSSS